MSNFQDRFSFVRLLTCGGIAFLLLGLFLTSSAQADTIYAVRVNALNTAGNSSDYANYNFSNYSADSRWCTIENGKPYDHADGASTPIMLCDLGSIQTINAINVVSYDSISNIIKTMTVDFYDSPALSGEPVYSQTFTEVSSALNTATTLTLANPTNARFVKFTLTSNNGGNRFGVSNVTFDVSSVVTPTSGNCTDGYLGGYPISYLFDKDASTNWCAYNGAAQNENYFDHFSQPVLTFELGGAKSLTGITVQAYNVTGNSIKDFKLEFLDSAGNAISVDDASKYSFTMNDSLNRVQNYFSFPTVEGVSQVKMTVKSNFNGVGAGGDRIGFSEVYFNTIETDAPITPEKYDSPMHQYNIIRPVSASSVKDMTDPNSDLKYLYDGSGTNKGNNVWYSRGSGSDYFEKGISPVIDFTMPSESMYDSFSVWGYQYGSNQMSNFILELFDSSGNLVYANEFKTTQLRNASQYSTFSFGDNYLFKTARMTILDNVYYWYNTNSGDRVAFAEIAFYQQPYYFVNTADIDANSWTINGTDKQGVLFTQGDKTATFAKPITLNADGVIEVAEGKTLLLTGGIAGSNKDLKKTGEGTLQIDSTGGGSVDLRSLLVSTGRLDMKEFFTGSLEIGEEIEEGVYTTAIFSPGNSIGILEMTGDFTLNPGSTLLMEIGGQSADANDQLIVNGDFNIADGAIIYLELANMGAFTTGDTFEVLIQAVGEDDDLTDAISDALVLGWPFTDWSVTKSGDGYSIRGVYDPNAVPEPSTWALLILGAAGLLYWRKRK
ncbi:MAG: PEP-CTERM sorting domain-containing protein [Thermoguttaceae bacterium]|nr:PEP-CTERM sorting domain-containing protein [Thermoguttaceae bacterium]